MDKIKAELKDTIENLAGEDIVNERKKRIAFATMNELLIENPDVKMTNPEIDALIEEVVSDVIK